MQAHHDRNIPLRKRLHGSPLAGAKTLVSLGSLFWNPDSGQFLVADGTEEKVYLAYPGETLRQQLEVLGLEAPPES